MARIRKANKNSNMMVTRAMASGGDLTTASFTITNNTETDFDATFPVCYEAGVLDEEVPAGIYQFAAVPAGETVTFAVPLYKGVLGVENVFDEDVVFGGDVEVVSGGVMITGDCTAKLGGDK